MHSSDDSWKQSSGLYAPAIVLAMAYEPRLPTYGVLQGRFKHQRILQGNQAGIPSNIVTFLVKGCLDMHGSCGYVTLQPERHDYSPLFDASPCGSIRRLNFHELQPKGYMFLTCEGTVLAGDITCAYHPQKCLNSV